MKKRILALLIAVHAAATAGAAPMPGLADAAEVPERERPKIGLALSGGGVRGAAHIGVLRVLEANRIPIDYIAGTSMGAVVGGLYSAGMGLDELEHVALSLDWADAFNDRVPRADRSFRRKRDDDQYLVKASVGISNRGEAQLPAGLVQGQKIDLLLKSFTAATTRVHDFDQLSIPFRAVASDIASGRPVVLSEGDLPTAIRASMSVPAVFAPVRINGRLLVDGGVTANLPVSVVREMGADIVIAVDISTPLLELEQLDSVLAIADQLSTLLTRRNTEDQIATLNAGDILIVPPLGDISTTDFRRGNEALEIGRQAAMDVVERLRELAIDEIDYQLYRKASRQRRVQPVKVDFVRIKNDSRLADEALEARIDIAIGEPLDILTLRRDIDAIYGMGLFENVHYEIVEEGNRIGLELHAKQRSWGPNYLQFGIALADDFRGQSNFNLAVAYTRTLMNSLGGEWRTGLAVGGEPGLFTEFYQPLDLRGRFFLLPQLEFQQRNVRLFEDGEAIAEFRVRSSGGELAFGRELGNWGELRAGFTRFNGTADLSIGDPNQLADDEFSGGETFLSLSLDELDNLNFPRTGRRLSAEWRMSRPGLGADVEFDQARLEFLDARSFGRHTLLLGASWGVTVNGQAPLQSQFRLGGFANLSGFDQNALAGQHRGLFSVGYLRRIGDIRFLPAYAGASLEYGNVWEERGDISLDSMKAAGSVFIGLDSFLGPIYLGYGRANGGNESFYLFLGRVF